jgi:hypothetical protein
MLKPSNYLFSFLLAISLLGIFLLSNNIRLDSQELNQFSSISVFFAGFVPLITYHLLLSFHKGFLTQHNIDSVYFFGFLVTLATLGSSAYILSAKGSEAINIVGTQFALGLLVTGYGLFARILLQNKIGLEHNIEDSLDNYIDKVSVLNDEFNKTIHLFNSLSSEAAKNVKDAGILAMNTIANDIEAPSNKIKIHLTAFLGQIQNLDKLNLDATRKNFSDFTDLLANAATETPKLNQNLQNLAKEVNSVYDAFSQLHLATQREGQNIIFLSEAMTKLTATAGNTNTVLTEFANSVPILTKINKIDLEKITDTVSSFFNALEDSKLKIEKFQSSISQNQNHLVSTFAETKESLSNQAKDLNIASNQLGNAMNELAGTLSQVANKLTT